MKQTALNPNMLLLCGTALMLGAMYLPKAYQTYWVALPALAIFLLGLGAFASAFGEGEERK